MTTFVLVHGAYQGGWIWQRVVARLTGAGHRLFAPTLDGCAERRHALRPGIDTESHAAEIAELLFFEDLHDAVLVGTSSGGMVVCKTAELARQSQLPGRLGDHALSALQRLLDRGAIQCCFFLGTPARWRQGRQAQRGRHDDLLA